MVVKKGRNGNEDNQANLTIQDIATGEGTRTDGTGVPGNTYNLEVSSSLNIPMKSVSITEACGSSAFRFDCCFVYKSMLSAQLLRTRAPKLIFDVLRRLQRSL
jgi:hypothetical protein